MLKRMGLKVKYQVAINNVISTGESKIRGVNNLVKKNWLNNKIEWNWKENHWSWFW